MRFANLNVVVVPAELLVWLYAGEKFCLGNEEGYPRDCLLLADAPKATRRARLTKTAADEVNGVVVREVHCRPPQPQGIECEKRRQLREDVAHEQSFDCGIAGMQGRKCAKDERGGSKCGGVEVDSKELIDARQACRRAGNAVICRGETVQVLIPRWRTREAELDDDACYVHVSKSAGKGGHGGWWRPDEHYDRAHYGRPKMCDTIREPCQNVEDRVFVGGEDVAEVGTIQDVFEGGEDADPYWRAVCAVNESTRNRASVVLLLDNKHTLCYPSVFGWKRAEGLGGGAGMNWTYLAE